MRADVGIEVSVGTVVVIMPNPGVTVAVATGASVGVGVSDGTGVSVGVKVAVGATGFRVKSAGSIMPAASCFAVAADGLGHYMAPAHH